MDVFSPQLDFGVKRLTKPFLAAGGYAFAMDNIYAIRRRNLNTALAMPKVARLGREQDKALLLGVSASMFSQAKHPEYKIGDDFARKVEAALGLESGWMDNNHGRAVSQSVGIDSGGSRYMKAASDLRRQNLAAIVAREGSQVAVAAKLGKDKNQIYQWLLELGTDGARNIGPRSARQIEQAFGLPDGWLDHEHDANAPASQSMGRDMGKLAKSVEMVRWAADVRSKAGLSPFTPLKEAALLEAVYNLLMSPEETNLVELGAYLNKEATGGGGVGQDAPRGDQEDGLRGPRRSAG